MAADDVYEILQVEAELDALINPTSSQVYRQTFGYTADAVAAVAASRTLSALEATTLDQIPAPEDDVGMNGHNITGLGTPTAATDAATKGYVDALAAGLDVKLSVRAATTANITLSGEQTIDGVAVVAGDRVLVKNQTAGAENGIYVAAAGAWARSTDADISAEVTSGLFTFIDSGTAQTDTGWVLATNNPITLGTTALAFTQFSGVGSGIAQTLADAKGDIFAATAADTVTRLAVGANKTHLTANSAAATGLQWVAENIDMKGFRSVNAYGAVQGGSTAQNTAIAACQAALNTDGGGIMYFPPGETMASPFTLKPWVQIAGAGQRVSYLSIKLTDPGGFALGPDPADFYPTSMRDISLVGPGGVVALGSAPCATHGLNVGRNTVLRNVTITGWNIGANMGKDHTEFDNVTFENCFKHVNYPTTSEQGDHLYTKCLFTGGFLAAICVDGNNCVNHDTFLHCHWVSTPFCFLHLAAGTGAFFNNSRIITPAMENVGCAIADYSTAGNNSWDSTWIEGSGYVQHDAYRYIGLDPVAGASDYAIYMPNVGNGNRIRNDYYPFKPRVGGVAASAYKIAPTAQVLLENTPATIAHYTNPNGRLILTTGHPVFFMVASGSITAGDIVEEVGNTGTVKRATGVPGAVPLVGIAINTSVSTAPIVISNFVSDRMTVLSETCGAGVPLAQKTGTYNVVGLASDYPANPVIGVSIVAGGNAGATATVVMRPKVVG